MLCCGFCCGNMSKRDYKVATMDGIELEPLGGEKMDKDKDKDNEKQTNGVTFGGESSGGRQTRNGVAVCSQKRALLVAGVVLGSLLLTALIIAYAGPSTDCSCARKLPTGLQTDTENVTEPFNPIATNGEPFPWLNMTLPTNARPMRYMVTIHPNLTTLDVKGQVTIDLFIEKETQFIVLHIQDLNVTEKAIVPMGNKGNAIKIVKFLEYPPRQQLYIELKDKLRKKSNYTLNLRWYSKLNPEPEGFYVDQYESSNGLERLLAATVFRPNGARKAFPCFDEPHIRAPFRVSVFRDRFHIETYLFNMATAALDIDAIQGWDSIINGTSHDGNNEDFYIQKTAAIFSMLHTAIGEDRFRSCLGGFLKLNRFKTAEPLDLWNICTKKANGAKNIKDMMSLWTHQSGFPLLTVTKLGNSVTISQKPFKPAEFLAIHDDTYDGNNYNKTTANSTTASTTTTTAAPTTPSTKHKPPQQMKWIFPITYVTDINNNTETLWMQNVDLTFNVPESVKWIKVNARQSGYYRVLYNDDNWANIIEDLSNDPDKFTGEDRLGLLSDAFTLCHANLLPCEITMNLIQYLPSETNWGPMALSLRHLEKWRRILKYSECFLMLSEFIKMKLSTVIEKIGWSDEGDEATRLMRPEVLLASVLWEDIDSISKSKNLLNQFLYYNGTAIPPNLREVVYTGSILSGEYIFWQHCWERFVTLQRNSDSYVERMQLLRALGRTKDAWLQNRLLSHVTMLPTAEVVQVLQAIAGTPTGGAMACRFLQAKWFELESRMGQGTLAFAKVISAITQYGATKFDYDELKSLVHRFGRGPGMGILNMTLSSVASNVEWVARSQPSLYKWVESNLHSH
uniref:Aminopeptidase n=1 Tax=Stomoxys calcitrans TaxID=35570 RepID=A0A1I8PN52_STOCA